jgi:hypothetical protein
MFKAATNRKQIIKMQQNRENFSANQQNFQESKFAHPKVDSIESGQN